MRVPDPRRVRMVDLRSPVPALAGAQPETPAP
jgi:hypothetical protein